MGNAFADFTETEDAQTFAANRRRFNAPLILPAARAHEAIRLAQMAHARQQQHDGGVGHRRRIHVRRVGDGDATAFRSGQINAFITRASGAHQFELRQQIHLGGGNAAATVGQHSSNANTRLTRGL